MSPGQSITASISRSLTYRRLCVTQKLAESVNSDRNDRHIREKRGYSLRIKNHFPLLLLFGNVNVTLIS